MIILNKFLFNELDKFQVSGESESSLEFEELTKYKFRVKESTK